MLHETIKPCLTSADVEAFEQCIGRIAFARDGTILRVNDRCLALFGYLGWDLVGRNRVIFKPEPSEDEPCDAIDRAFENGEPYFGEMRQLKRDGTIFWTEISCIPIKEDGETVSEVVLFVRDATDRMMSAVDDAGQIAAINTSQAVIHFAMNGTILHANDRFLAATGYRLDEIVGQHHRIFVDGAEAAAPSYEAFWDSLRDGSHASGEYRRFGKNGQAVWLRATYNPIFDLEGRPFKIVKYAVDVTPEKKQTADFQGQIAAIDKSQCVVTFAPDGTIIDA
ncbi:PAS domain-containing protein, partial [Sphingobium sp.]|uniref:PAS domain-containing protein n=1 Tax=Sphingobium sp. TaxID=1912891 RepID=UPI003B3B09D6